MVRALPTLPDPSRVVSPKRRAFRVCVGIAIVAHLPFLPLNLGGWMGLLSSRVEVTDLHGETIIPIDLSMELPSDPGGATDGGGDGSKPGEGDVVVVPVASAPPPPSASAPPPVMSASAPPVASADTPPPIASASAAPTASVDPDDPERIYDDDPPAASSAEPIASAPVKPEAPKAGVGDPMKAAGGASKVAGDSPNVQVYLASDRLRTHRFGADFGRLLTALPQWASFFQGTGIDPIHDLDHVLIAGPQFRDFRQVVAVMDYNVSSAKIKKAIDQLVVNNHGEHLENTPVPAATLIPSFDRSPRILAHVQSKHLLVLLPADAKGKLSELKSMSSFPKSQVGILISMVTPGRAFRGGMVNIPESIKSGRLSVTPNADGSALVQLELLDASAEQAAAHAEGLTSDMDQVRGLPLASKFIDRVEFTASGPKISGVVTVSRQQLAMILALVPGMLGLNVQR